MRLGRASRKTKSLLLLPRSYSNLVLSRLKQLTRSLESVATLTHTTSLIASFARATKRFSTSFTPTRATAPATTAPSRSVAPPLRSTMPMLWPKATDIGFANEMDAFGLQFGHGLGLGLHERPIISRLNSLSHPVEIKAGMVFALETYCPSPDGISAARIEEEVVITNNGAQVITKFPAEKLFITNPY
jgi:methionine aminopeptidase